MRVGRGPYGGLGIIDLVGQNLEGQLTTAPDVREASPWAGVDIRTLLNRAALAVGAGTPTDQGVPWVHAPTTESPILLAGGVPDPETLPSDELLACLERALRDTGALTYGGVLGFEGLREALADRYSRLDGLPLGPDNFILNNGSSGSIANVCDAFVEPGDVVLVESPTFSGSLRTMRGHLADIVAVPLHDPDGVESAISVAEAAGKRVKLLYTVADFHNPTGETMPRECREALVELCAARRVLIVEDAAYADIYFGSAPPPSLYGMASGEGILRVGTFSKPIATGLRVGWVQAREDFIHALSSVKFDMGSSPLLLRALADYVGSGGMDAHLDEMRLLYQAKCEALCLSLAEHCPEDLQFTKPQGGFFLWVESLEADAQILSRCAAEEGLVFPAGSLFFLNGRDDDTSHVRLAFSTATVEEMAQVGPRMRRALGRALDYG